MEASQLPELSQPTRLDGQRLGERLRAERQRAGMTVREVAARIGVSPSLISQIERDKVNPSVSTLWSLVTALGVSMGELFADVAPPELAATAAGPGPVTAPGGRAVIDLESGVHWERLTPGTDRLVE